MIPIWTGVTDFYRKLLYRPTRDPDPAVALGVRSTGHYYPAPGSSDRKMTKNFVQLFWSVRNAGIIHLKGVPFRLRPGMIAFYFPGDLHDVVFPENGPAWEYRWLTLDGDLALPIVEGFRFTNLFPYDAGPAPVEWFERLAGHLQDVTLTGELLAGAVAFEILSKAAERAQPWKETARRRRHPVSLRRLEALHTFRKAAIRSVRNHWADPGFGVEQIAAELGLHRSVFSRKFHAAFGLSPSHYLLRYRTQQALNLLRNSGMPVTEIARTCGWHDPNYFARCIRKATGVSPSAFRHRNPLGAGRPGDIA